MTDAGGNTGATEMLSARPIPLHALLQRLSADGDGATAYSRLHFRLVTYFRLRFPAEAETLADEVMDRLARRLGDGTPVLSLSGYSLGIARLVCLEAGTRQRKEHDAAREATLQLALSEQEVEPDPAVPALRICLESLDPESAAFILEYYAADSGAARIARRQALAHRLGMSPNALRNRALRLRLGLERCVQGKLQTTTPGTVGDETPNLHTTAINVPDPRRK